MPIRAPNLSVRTGRGGERNEPRPNAANPMASNAALEATIRTAGGKKA